MLNEPLYLSYALSRTTPGYGRPEQGIDISTDKQMTNGDSCDTYTLGFSNHIGTHMDGPAHFIPHGKRLHQLAPDFFVFERIHILSVDVREGQLIRPSDVQLRAMPDDMDCLLIKTGFCEKRDLDVYALQNPGFDPDIADDLGRFGRLRAVGMDLISVSSFMHRDIGRVCHRRLLSQGLVLIEDMDLRFIPASLSRLIALPLLVEDIDSAPCTVLGWPDD